MKYLPHLYVVSKFARWAHPKEVKMHRVLCYCFMSTILLLLGAADINAEPRILFDSNTDLSIRRNNNSPLVAQLLSIQEEMHQTNKLLFFLRIDVIQSTMTAYQLTEDSINNYSLEELSTCLVGTPKSKKYPKGFGVITSIERSPRWAPTPETVRLFKRRGINLEKFRNAKGKIIIPSGHPLNYMGSLKMNIRFLEKQASLKLERNVYRIHGTLKKDEEKLGTRCSGGCIRTQNEELIALDKMMKGGLIIIKYI